jgi:hypothetical protein
LATNREGAVESTARRVRVPLAIGALAAAVWFFPRLEPAAREHERDFLVDPVHFESVAGPKWLDGAIGDSVRAALAQLDPTPLRDDAAVAALAHRIERASAWVRSVDRLEKRYPNRLEVAVTLREPLALVPTELGLALADEQVVVAFAADATDYLRTHELPIVRAPRPLRSPTCGGPVDDADLQEALRVAAELAPSRDSLALHRLDVAVIDVTAPARSGRLAATDVELYTSGGLAVEWGRSRGHPRLGALERPADAKLRDLVSIAVKNPGLAGIVRVKLQFEKPWIVREPESPLALALPP